MINVTKISQTIDTNNRQLKNYADIIDKNHSDNNGYSIVEDSEFNYYPKDQYPFQEESYQLIGAAMEVHKTLGKGFVESVYHEALCIELTERKIPFESNKVLNVYYKGAKPKKSFDVDILAYDQIIVELKAIDGPLDPHYAQIINYLSASKHSFGLLINFGTPSLKYRRFIYSKNNYETLP